MLAYLRSLISDNGNASMTRFLSLMCVVAAVLIAFIGLAVGGHTPESLSVLCATFLGAGLGAKVWQRSIESKELDSSATEAKEAKEAKPSEK